MGPAVKETPASEPRLQLGEVEGRGGGCEKQAPFCTVFSSRAREARCFLCSHELCAVLSLSACYK